MKFQRVYELNHGEKYKIIHHLHEYTATFKTCFLCNPVLYEFTSNEKVYYHYVFTGYNPYKYYVPIFQRDRIQNAMERRAVNLILQRITGDPTFTW